MKTLTRIFLFLIWIGTVGQSATRSDINTIEAAEKIRYLSQKIAKDYLHLYSRPQRTDLKETLENMIKELGKNFDVIADSTRDNDTKDLLQYLRYNKKNIEELLSKNPTKERSQKMLDYSEILLEGADSIAREHSYQFNREERMLMNIKKDEYLLQRLGKFYMASHLGTLSNVNQKKMKESEAALRKGLDIIQYYPYPDTLKKQKKELDLFWKSSHYILSHVYDMYVPNIIATTSDYFEMLLNDLARYHSKSQ